MRSVLRGLGLILLLFWACGGTPSRLSQEVQNLRAFAKLYGYARFFNPSDEAADIDWNRFAVYGAERIKPAADSTALKTALEELFLPLAPAMQIYKTEEGPPAPALSIPADTSGLKVVAWQHQGVGLGNSPIYKSIRVNRENLIPYGATMGGVSRSMPAVDLRGKEIKYSAFVRVEPAGRDSRAQLWLRIDRADRKLGFFENMDDRPIKADEWRKYEISGQVDEDAQALSFGCMFFGAGKLQLDKVEIAVKTAAGWAPLTVSNPGFEETGPEQNPIGWATGRQPNSGFSYRIDTDGPVAGKNCLAIEKKPQFFRGQLFPALPDPEKPLDLELDAGLSCLFYPALYSMNGRTLGGESRYSLQALLARLAALDSGDMTADREPVRTADIIITWNIMQHFYPYFDVVAADWDRELNTALQSAFTDSSEHDFFFTLSRMVAALQDGHGNVFHSLVQAQSGLPIKVDWVEERLVVTVSQDPNKIQRGDVLLEIDGVEADAALREAEKYISGSSQWRRYRSLQRFGYGETGTQVRLKLRRGDMIKEITTFRVFNGYINEPVPEKITELESGIYYVNLDQASWPEIQSHLENIASGRGVIFDLRGYPKGNHMIISHLLTENVTTLAWMHIPQRIYPDQVDIAGFVKSGWPLIPRKPQIQGKVVFITDGRAISYAESFLGFIEFYKLAEIVGQPTAGANGNVNPFDLPGGFRVVWTGMKVVKHDDTQHHTIGIQPTIPVKRTISGIKAGEDELLNTALALINEQDQQ